MKTIRMALLLFCIPAALCLSRPTQTSAEASGRANMPAMLSQHSITSYQIFWQGFRGAVIKGNKTSVADMSQFPISMPYGMRVVRNRAQLIRRFREVFNHEGSAAKCFAEAIPKTDPERPKEFTVGCKNAAGDEVVIYSFTRGKHGWKFTGLDNLNE